MGKAHDPLIPVRPLSWKEVFSIWRDGEARLPRWVQHYTKRGFSSWDEWRTHTVRDLHCEALSWELFEVSDPAAAEDFFAGPFRAWQAKYYDGAHIMRFRDLAMIPALRSEKIVLEMGEHFPGEAYLVGLRTKEGIVIVEGMHRACALAVAAREGRSLDTHVFLALAPFEGEIPTMGQADSPT